MFAFAIMLQQLLSIMPLEGVKKVFDILLPFLSKIVRFRPLHVDLPSLVRLREA